jgi:OCT family organic cation transporter-like MFS transporter 4/5
MMPTLIRSGTVGTFSTLARFYSLVAPFVPLLAKFHAFLPLLVFGGFAFTAGILALLLPETLGIKLPDTIAQAENIGKTIEEMSLHDERTHL